MLDGGHVQIDASKVFQHHRIRRAALKPGKSLDVPKAALAPVDYGIGTVFLRHQRDQLSMIAHGAVRAIQRARVPLSAASAAAEIAVSLDAAHFGKGRQRPADGTVPFHPACGNRRRPAAVGGMQKRDRKQGDDSVERLRVRARNSRDFVDAIAVLTK